MYLSVIIAVSQLIDAYIRYLAFSKQVTEETTRKLFLQSTLWSLASIFVYATLFARLSVDAGIYKAVLMTGWLPYFIICARLIPWGLPQHVFVFGMGVICSLLQHTVGAPLVLSFVGRSEYDLILLEATIYLCSDCRCRFAERFSSSCCRAANCSTFARKEFTSRFCR